MFVESQRGHLSGCSGCGIFASRARSDMEIVLAAESGVAAMPAASGGLVTAASPGMSGGTSPPPAPPPTVGIGKDCCC